MNAPLSNLRADIEMMRAHIELLTEPVRTTHPDLRFEIAWSDDTGQVEPSPDIPAQRDRRRCEVRSEEERRAD